MEDRVRGAGPFLAEVESAEMRRRKSKIVMTTVMMTRRRGLDVMKMAKRKSPKKLLLLSMRTSSWET
jgi:hypothetical protein